jgi:hypothetical protein
LRDDDPPNEETEKKKLSLLEELRGMLQKKLAAGS